jgi:hypothetical protein
LDLPLLTWLCGGGELFLLGKRVDRLLTIAELPKLHYHT